MTPGPAPLAVAESDVEDLALQRFELRPTGLPVVGSGRALPSEPRSPPQIAIAPPAQAPPPPTASTGASG
jgi:hypothetical protein